MAVRLLAANQPRLIILAAGSISVALAASSIALASVVSVASLENTLAVGWRGSYDILVRPVDALSLEVGDRTVVPANYLEAPTSGISRTQWETVRRIPGVETAAPVAAVGWMKQDDVLLEVQLQRPQPGQILRIDVTSVIGGRTGSEGVSLLSVDPASGEPRLNLGTVSVATSADEVAASVVSLPSTWGFVVAVDPTQEQALIGLSDYVDGTYLSAGVRQVEDLEYGGPAISVPVITASSTPLDGLLQVQVRSIDGADDQEILAALQREVDERQAAGRPLPTMSELTALALDAIGDADDNVMVSATGQLEDLIRPLRARAVVLRADGALRVADQGGTFSAYGRNVLLVPHAAPYEASEDGLRLAGAGTWHDTIAPAIRQAQPDTFAPIETGFGGDEPVYRPLEVEVPPLFRADPIGTYDLQAISEEFSGAANYAPLGIYADIPRRVVAVDGSLTDLPVSLNPAGLNPLPPVGLTNLEAAEALRGPRFIDAIRVRVADIDGYGPETQAQIEAVARAIAERTGLRVDVVAGSSPIDLRVDVPERGTLIERWTTLGEALRIQGAITGFSGMLLWVAGLVAGLYLLTFGLFLVVDQRRDLAVARLLGWRRTTIRDLVVVQASIMGIAAALVAVMVLGVLAAAMGIAVPPPIWALVALGTLLAHPLAAGAAAAMAESGAVSNALRGETRSKVSRQRLRGVAQLGVTLAAESPLRAVGVVIAVALATGLSAIVVGVQLLVGGRLDATVLGGVVNITIGPYHLLAAAAALFAAGAMAIDSAILGVERRLVLIGLVRAVGWSRGAIRRLVISESSLPPLVGGMLAAAIVTGALVILGTNLAVAAGLGAVALVGATALASATAVLASDVASRGTPQQSLGAEGRPAVVDGWTRRAALLSVGSFLVMVVAGGGLWGMAGPRPIPPGAFTTPPASPGLTPSAQQIARDVSSIAALPDRGVASPALRSAQGYVRSQLEAAGYQVEEIPFVSAVPEMTYPDEPLSSLIASAIAYVPSLAPGGATFDAVEITYLENKVASSSQCPRGLAVIRIGRSVAEHGGLSPAAELASRCAGTTAAALAVTAPDAEWEIAPGSISSIRLYGGVHLVAAPRTGSPEQPSRWVVAPVTSSGPGATQSAAPAAVALEMARLAAAGHTELGLAFIADEGGAAAVFYRWMATAHPAAEVVVLGPMGGAVPMALGTTHLPPSVTPADIELNLIAALSVDGTERDWIHHTLPEDLRTSAAWLGTLSEVGLTPTDAARQNVFGLGAGLDAASVGEVVGGSIPSVAGTSTDTADQVRAADLAELAERLLAAMSWTGAS